MIDLIKSFIEENIDLIEQDNWEEVYQKASNELGDDTGKFTEAMLAADIHPENYLKELSRNFLSNSNIKKFEIPNNITSIGEAAFWNCSSLANVTVGDNVTEIGTFAFRNCHRLTSVVIGDSVTTIGEYAFWHCSSLTNLIIPDSVTMIEEGAFAGCSRLTSVTIPSSVISIGGGVCSNCKDLNIVYMGTKEQWKNIAKDKFYKVTYRCTCVDGIVKKSR